MSFPTHLTLTDKDSGASVDYIDVTAVPAVIAPVSLSDADRAEVESDLTDAEKLLAFPVVASPGAAPSDAASVASENSDGVSSVAPSGTTAGANPASEDPNASSGDTVSVEPTPTASVVASPGVSPENADSIDNENSNLGGSVGDPTSTGTIDPSVEQAEAAPVVANPVPAV
jgi:hypothetical protein